MIKINVERMEEELNLLLSFLATENYYIIQDFNFVDMTNNDDCLKKEGMYGVFKNIEIGFSLYNKSGKTHNLKIGLNQIKLDYDFKKEKLYGFYDVVHIPAKSVSKDVENIFNEFFVESRIFEYFNRNDMEQFCISSSFSERFIKINIEDINNEVIKLIDATLDNSIFNYDREDVEIQHSIYTSKNLHKSIFVEFNIRETGRKADFILDLRHMQYDYDNETMYGFFNVGTSNVFAILRDEQSEMIFCSISTMIEENNINLGFNKNVNAFI